MSSSHPPPDCALQLPSWDEFDPTEELDYNESDLENDEHSSSSPKDQQPVTIGPTLPRGFDMGASTSPSPSSSRIRSADEREQRSSVPPDVKHSIKAVNSSGDENNTNDSGGDNRINNNNGKQVSSTSFFDQLPSSLPQHFDEHDQPCSSNASSSRPLGPALPPGFMLNDGHNEEDDPEDPGDPEDPDENDSRSKVPNLCSSEGRMSESVNRPSASALSSSSARIGPIGPAVPPGFGDCSPSLPDDEIRPRLQGHFTSSTMPPPEPEETRGVPSWSSSSRLSNARSDSRTIIGPVVPDLLPTVSHHQQRGADEEEGEGDEEEEGTYGPTVPPDLNPSTSHQKTLTSNNHHSTDNLEMPTEDDEHCGVVHVSEVDDDDDNDIVGELLYSDSLVEAYFNLVFPIYWPMPPCESVEVVQKEYKHRLSAFEAEQLNKGSTSKREEWMVKLPKKLNSFGLGARTFSKSSAGGSLTDQDGVREWTETPQQKAARLSSVCFPCSDNEPTSSSTDTSNRLRSASLAERDLLQQQRASNLNKDRNASLLEIHRRKRKADDGCGDSLSVCSRFLSSLIRMILFQNEQSTSRHAFDRERDMQIANNRGLFQIICASQRTLEHQVYFKVKGLRGDASVDEIKERCGKLASRFGHSSTQKFL
ncbi:unnamed protein product [Anisakis simplex]|uniref:DUF3752 domain-containing protein n=1 Tax=Anisakis simplex TaxID=6269 RepID=A0A0M3K081_ANISI|nr:unnamed protein product [Anisakis simplex]